MHAFGAPLRVRALLRSPGMTMRDWIGKKIPSFKRENRPVQYDQSSSCPENERPVAVSEQCDYQANLLRNILPAISHRLSPTEVEDIASFIDAGENGLAADTIFCAISEEAIDVDAAILRDLAEVENLYNTFGDLDPEIAGNVLRHERRPSPGMGG